MQEKATRIHRIRNIDTSSIENQLEGIFRAHVNMSQELVSLRECLIRQDIIDAPPIMS